MNPIIERVRRALGVQAGDGRERIVFAKSEGFVNCAEAPVPPEERAGWMDSIRAEAKALKQRVEDVERDRAVKETELAELRKAQCCVEECDLGNFQQFQESLRQLAETINGGE